MSRIHLTVSNLISYSQAAQTLGVSRQTIYAMIDRGELRPFAIGRHRYLFAEEVEKIRESRSTPPETQNK